MSEASSDLCPGCKESTIPGKTFCANCGASLNNDTFRIKALIDEALESRFKDRDYVTMETSVDVATKLTDWFKLFLYWAAIPVGVLAIILGVFGFRSYSDFTAKVADSTTRVQNASQAAISKDAEVSEKLGALESHIVSAEAQVSGLQASSGQIGQKYARLQSDYGKYQQIAQKVGALQSQLTAVQTQVVDLGNRTLRAGAFESSGVDENGVVRPSSMELANLGCGPKTLTGGRQIALCAVSSPLRPFVFFFQRSPNGDEIPIGSVSPVGFQDVSTAPRPACTMAKRGTICVEKGNRGSGDQPYLCLMNPNGTSKWIGLQLAP